MGLILLPSIHAPAIDPDKLAERVMSGELVVDAPMCQRCGRKHTDQNPICASPRKVWNRFDPNRLSRQFDFICARCREVMARA